MYSYSMELHGYPHLHPFLTRITRYMFRIGFSLLYLSDSRSVFKNTMEHRTIICIHEEYVSLVQDWVTIPVGKPPLVPVFQPRLAIRD
jgi:hypothetical protein